MILSYIQFINEQEEKKELSSGKKAALSRGDELVSEQQFALMYLASFGQDTKEMLEIMKISDNYKAMSGVKPSTWEHTIRKWKVLTQDANYDTEPSAEMIKLYKKFQDMSSKELVEFASDCFDEDHVKSWDEETEKIRLRNSDSAQKAKGKKASEEQRVYQTLKDYFAGFKNNLDKAIKATISKYPDYTEKQLKLMWAKK